MYLASKLVLLDALLTAALTAVSYSATSFKENITVTNTYGILVGRRFILDDRMLLDVYKGIPYAEPPVGERRFRKTAPFASNWSGDRLAFDYSSVCPQKLDVIKGDFPDITPQQMNEDCLYLNIYSPLNKDDPPNKLYPILVWVHGGAYLYGAGSQFEGGFLAQNGVVVVTINYRLGVFGFLSTASSESRGNYGLWDQVEALRWVQNNIEAFRGNKSHVTLAGQSAGGGSVGLLMFSKYSTGLFQQVIAQSGIALAPWAILRPPFTPRTTALEMATKVGCNSSSDSAIMACLRTVSVDTLINTPVSEPFPVPEFAPVMDSDFLTDWPERLLSKGDVIKVPVMSGTTKDDTSNYLDAIPGIENGISNNRTDEWISTLADRFKVIEKSTIVKRLLRQHYRHFAKLNDPVLNRQALIDLLTDYFQIYPHNEFSRLYSAYEQQTYLYSMEYRSTANSTNPAWMGVFHTIELYYLMPFWSVDSCPWGCEIAIFDNVQWNDADRSISDLLIQLWSNFIKTGNPNTPSPIDVTWEPFNADTERYLVIDNISRSDSFQKAASVSFWREVFWPIINDFVCHEEVTPSRPPISIELGGITSSAVILNSCIVVWVVSMLLSKINL